jgi:hypothetical protein
MSNVWKIIKKFKYHMHPGLSASENFFLYPDEFNIHFYYNGQENTWINRIGSCVLTNLTLNHSPNGFNVFRETMKDRAVGAPPAQIDMTLQFVETSLLTKNDIKEGLL